MTDEFNYLSLKEEKDQQEPLIGENQIENKSSFNFIDNIKTITHCETKIVPEENTKPEKIQQYSSSEDESSQVEKNAALFKKQQDNAIRKLIYVCVICTIFMIIEIIGGYLANSIAIMSDAAHLLSDLLGFLISIISIYISRKVAKNDISY